jgi:hypothetical protein
MKQIKHFYLAIAALAAITIPAASNAVFIDLSLIEVDGGSPTIITAVEDEDQLSSFDIFYSFTVYHSHPSSGEETEISLYSEFLHPDGESLEISGSADCGFGDTSGFFSCSGSISALDPAVFIGDVWTITLSDSNDNPVDYIFNNGAYIAWGDDVPSSSVPEPSILLLMGAGILGLGLTRIIHPRA